MPVAGSEVVLHGVTRDSGGPIDSARTDARGQYRLDAPTVDTTATYLVSVEYSGLGYFSEPLQTFGARMDTASTLVVHDTTHASPPIVIAERHLVIRGAQPDGSRRIVELLILQNRGLTTRIAFDSLTPVWQAALPPNAVQFEVGDSDVSVQAVRQRGDSVVVFAPIPPGDRQLLLSYTIPSSAKEFPVPVDAPVASLNVLLEDTAATVVGGPLALRGVEELDDLFFRRYTGGPVLPTQSVTVVFAAQPVSLVSYWWVIVVLTTIALAWGLWRWLRLQPVRTPPVDADTIARQIVVLDERFEQRKAAAGAEERREYEQRRAELKLRLRQALHIRS